MDYLKLRNRKLLRYSDIQEMTVDELSDLLNDILEYQMEIKNKIDEAKTSAYKYKNFMDSHEFRSLQKSMRIMEVHKKKVAQIRKKKKRAEHETEKVTKIDVLKEVMQEFLAEETYHMIIENFDLRCRDMFR